MLRETLHMKMAGFRFPFKLDDHNNVHVGCVVSSHLPEKRGIGSTCRPSPPVAALSSFAAEAVSQVTVLSRTGFNSRRHDDCTHSSIPCAAELIAKKGASLTRSMVQMSR